MTRSVPVAKAYDDALLAYGQNGEALRPEQGYPARLFLPGWEGNASVKWIRRIELDEERRMTPGALADAIDADRAEGVTPVAVIATAGTTLTGAVDQLDALADVTEPRGVWLHVDGAYGLPAAAAPSASALFAGLDRTDSATIDAHKWLGVQKPCSVSLS